MMNLTARCRLSALVTTRRPLTQPSSHNFPSSDHHRDYHDHDDFDDLDFDDHAHCDDLGHDANVNNPSHNPPVTTFLHQTIIRF